ncbi:MAG: hypothetical protein WCF85_10905 [Rhodospirillaceae bacterium]
MSRLSDQGTGNITTQYSCHLDEQVGHVLAEKLVTINAVLDEGAGIVGKRVEGSEESVRAQVIAALLSHEQRAVTQANAVQKKAAKTTKRRKKPAIS